MKVLAILDKAGDSDDGVTSVFTGCVSGMPPTPDITQINSKNVICLDVKLAKFLLDNWDKWCNSPEYALCSKLNKFIKEGESNET